MKNYLHRLDYFFVDDRIYMENKYSYGDLVLLYMLISVQKYKMY